MKEVNCFLIKGWTRVERNGGESHQKILAKDW